MFKSKSFFQIIIATAVTIFATVGIVIASTTIGNSISTEGDLTVGTNQFVVKQSSGYVGVGTSTPAYKLTINSANGTDNLFQVATTTDQGIMAINNQGYVAIGTTTPSGRFTISGADGEATVIHIYSFAINAGFNVYRANGTQASPSALLATNPIFQIGARGYGATGYSTLDKAQIGFMASENWTDTAQGTYIAFGTTLNGTITRSEKMRIYNNGSVGIGTLATSWNTPTSTLTVVGSGLFTGNATTSGNFTANNTLYVQDGKVGIGTTTPATQLQVTNSSDNATTTMRVGKAGQSKGTCLQMYDEIGVVKYVTIRSGSFVISDTNCQ